MRRTGVTLPKVVGHRGAAAIAPENTLAGMRAAAAARIHAVEIDLRLTLDGALVALHDGTLDRTTDGSGRVALLPLAAIRARDAGAWFGPAFKGERVPTLDEALSLARELGLALNIELKADPGRERETGRAVMTALGCARALPPVLISSFLPRCLAARSRWPRALIVGRGAPAAWVREATRLGAVAIHARQDRLDRATIAALHAAGFAVGAYTVNDGAQARALFGWGVDSVFSDDPGRIMDAVA